MMMAHIDVKMGASQRRVEKRQDPQGMELPTEIYFTKYGTRYHMFPNCPTIKESDVLERHICKVCLRKVDQGESIAVSDRDHLGPRCVCVCVARESSNTAAPKPGLLLVWQRGPFRERLPASAVRRLPEVKSGEYLKKENEKMSYQKEHQKDYKYKDY